MKKIIGKKFINTFLKVLLVVVFLIVIWRQLFVQNDFSKMSEEFVRMVSVDNLWKIVLVFLLMIFNWSTEALKWKTLISQFEKISFINSLKTVLSGLSAGIVTPGNVGDYFGRILLIKPENNRKAILSTFICSISQNIATVIFGLLGLVYSMYFILNFSKYIIISTFFTGIGIVVFALLVYYNMDLVLRIVKRLGFGKYLKKTPFKDDLSTDYISDKALNKVLILSFVRYLIFSTQYLLLFSFFGISGDFIGLISSVFAIFFIQTGIPVPAIANVLARSEIAFLMIGHFTDNKIMILASTLSLWIINLLIPATVGLFVIVRINISKSLGYE